ncbi:Probable monooxygenase, FAD-binding [Mycobacteroides abscessus subsp. abscessus]|nr:Probable monooxygenase, FAD-binding [Mycobacteroides abscessus subsp. abscessus]
MIKPELPQGTTCAIAGGGPAGMMLALLLARAGIDVTVLEKHPDFLRDFRGDTVHASTLNLIDELGLGPRFAAMPHNLVEQVTVYLTVGVIGLILGALAGFLAQRIALMLRAPGNTIDPAGAIA